jgi:hypothetical protein
MIKEATGQTAQANGVSTPGPTSRHLVQTPADVRRRSNLFRQSLRYVVLNFKIFRLTRQHH